jgi:hypothetical protein
MLYQLIHTNHIRQKKVGDKEGEEEEDDKFHCTHPYLFCIPRHFAQVSLCGEITINPVFYLPENHFHEYGLRAGPSAEYPSKNHRKQDDKYNESDHGYPKDEKILWPENQTEDDKFPFKHIEHQ